MKNPIKQMGLVLAAALVMAAVISCGPSVKLQPSATVGNGRQTADPAQSSGSNSPPSSVPVAPVAAPVPAPVVNAAPAAKSAAADDELDIAIRDASDYLNDNIPKGSKIVILNIESNAANLSEYIIDELIANAVNDKNFSVVDRRQLEAIQSEQKFQMSGAVDEKDALAIGKFFGAQTIISGAMRDIGGRYRMTIRALSVQTAQVQGQYNRNMAVSESLYSLANSGGSKPVSGTSSSAATGSSTTQAPAVPAAATSGSRTRAPANPAATSASPAAPAEPPIEGIPVPGKSLAEKLSWLTRSADSHNTYIIEVNADEKIAPHTFEYPGAINITIVLRGVGENRTIRLRTDGTMFTVADKITFILDNNITLRGHIGNGSAMVRVNRGGILKMNSGSTITGNHGRSSGDGAGGVDVYGTFEMNGGTISNNAGSCGGGVVVIIDAFFTMRGGIITGNTASNNGGGVCVWTGCTFTKTGGTITGYKSDPNNGNVVKDEDGNELGRRGHALWEGLGTRKETTAGPNANMSYSARKGFTGDWDN
jgi:TolB-like protein